MDEQDAYAIRTARVSRSFQMRLPCKLPATHFFVSWPYSDSKSISRFRGRNGTSHDAPARVRQPCFDKKPRMRGRVDMSIFTILFIVLLLAWILGFGVFHVAGALIHILLVLGGYCAGHSLC